MCADGKAIRAHNNPQLLRRFRLWQGLGLALVVGLALMLVEAQGPAPLGTGFTYLGLLAGSDTGKPVAGPCDLRFSLYDSLTADDPEGAAQVAPGVEPDNGYFAVDLDFGAAAFTGEARDFEIVVDCGEGGATLSPWVNLQPVPYALYATSTWSPSRHSGTTPGTNLLGTTDDQALELYVNGSRALRIDPHSLSPNVSGHSRASPGQSGLIEAADL